MCEDVHLQICTYATQTRRRVPHECRDLVYRRARSGLAGGRGSATDDATSAAAAEDDNDDEVRLVVVLVAAVFSGDLRMAPPGDVDDDVMAVPVVVAPVLVLAAVAIRRPGDVRRGGVLGGDGGTAVTLPVVTSVAPVVLAATVVTAVRSTCSSSET